jgi:hypothetical protein
MSKSRKRRRSSKRVLALPYLEHAKPTVLNSLISRSGQLTYDRAIVDSPTCIARVAPGLPWRQCGAGPTNPRQMPAHPDAACRSLKQPSSMADHRVSEPGCAQRPPAGQT